ncbi:hypothetical protein LOTGIDRAFT_132754 [Lottia gigantea]|uniref:Cx9C motif-containing protein 4 n=1 Tax=Lottia gigantea TaxID=225164 RepID=V4B5L1_LOTGI|nr:hypothetical protein LOTGIDRAFT_132754 [Lottia gigantea]ESO83794.1 hypothetical protein LOTGIDRAFT_132754 [Lottia gigantea]
MPKTDPCQKQACAIQKCLQANNYQESKCESVLEDMKKCCEKFGKLSGCCDGIKYEKSHKNLS